MEPGRSHLLVDLERRAFRAPGTDVWTEVGSSARLQQLLECVVAQRRQRPGEELSLDDLSDVLWPGETILPEAAANRVYNAVSRLRTMGLGSLLVRGEGGYRLDPAVPLCVGNTRPPARAGLAGETTVATDRNITRVDSMRILIARPLYDSHDEGAALLSAALRAAGLEVVATEERRTADDIRASRRRGGG